MRDSRLEPSGSSFGFELLETRRLLSGAPPYTYATDNDIVYGSDGTIHVAWYNSQAGSLNYASRTSGGAWSSAVTVDEIANLPANTAGVGQYVSIALDSQNRPALSYFDAYNGDLKFASRTSGSWSVFTNIENTAALYPSLVFNGGDAPVISYYQQNTRDLKLARWTGSTWHRQTVDATDDVGRSSSIHMVPGSPDRVAIAYEKTTGGDFKFAEVTAAGAWSIGFVDQVPEAGGGFTSLDFDTNNNPAFSYYDSWTSTLMYAARGSNGTWSTQAISGRISHWSNLWFSPSDGSAHLVYYDVSGNLINHLTKTPTGNWSGANAELRLGGGNYVQAAFKNDGTIAYTYGSPYSAAVPSLGVGVLAGNLVQQPVLSSTPSVVSHSRIDVSWTYGGSANSGFKIGISTDGGRTFAEERVVTSASARSAQITGLSGSTSYTFTVRAYNAAGDSTFSNTASATTPIAPPAAPGGLSATAASHSQIDLAWSDVANETGYKIERSLTGTGGWSQVAQVGANVTAYSDTGLSSNTTYHYRVRATNGSGDSAYATFAAVTTPLGAPANFAAAAQSTSRIDLAWSALSGATGYVVQQLVGTEYVQIATLGASATGHSVGGLSAGTGYTFRLYATSTGGNSAAVTATATTAASTVADPTGTPLAHVTDAGAGAGGGFAAALAARGNLILSGHGWQNGGAGGAVVVDAVTGNVVRRFANPAATPSTDDGFGMAVAFVGDRIAIAAPGGSPTTGKVYVYDDLEDTVPDLVLEGSLDDGFGHALVAIGDDLIVSAPYAGDGLVRRYDLSSGQVTATFATRPLDPSQTHTLLGLSIAADAATDTVLIGSRTPLGTSVVELDASTGSPLRRFDVLGGYSPSVAYSAGGIFVGDDSLGAVFQYDRTDTSATPSPVYTYTGPLGSGFGRTLAVSGDRLLVTAPTDPITIEILGVSVSVGDGAAYVYDTTDHSLVQRIGNPTIDPLIQFGSADTFASTVVVLGGGEFAIGDPTDDASNLIDVGSVYVFDV